MVDFICTGLTIKEITEMKFNIKAMALACGIFWSIAIFLMTWWLIMLEGSGSESLFISRFYVGYDISPVGSVIGFAYGFVDGSISGAIFAWLYNLIAAKMQP
ncbi:MAG: hypothetical protein IEMM0002_1004 [bacterium]|nr:MAG: hypothetical protein IEMM0002_1004 [bacterium]